MKINKEVALLNSENCKGCPVLHLEYFPCNINKWNCKLGYFGEPRDLILNHNNEELKRPKRCIDENGL